MKKIVCSAWSDAAKGSFSAKLFGDADSNTAEAAAVRRIEDFVYDCCCSIDEMTRTLVEDTRDLARRFAIHADAAEYGIPGAAGESPTGYSHAASHGARTAVLAAKKEMLLGMLRAVVGPEGAKEFVGTVRANLRREAEARAAAESKAVAS